MMLIRNLSNHLYIEGRQGTGKTFIATQIAGMYVDSVIVNEDTFDDDYEHITPYPTVLVFDAIRNPDIRLLLDYANQTGYIHLIITSCQPPNPKDIKRHGFAHIKTLPEGRIELVTWPGQTKPGDL